MSYMYEQIARDKTVVLFLLFNLIYFEPEPLLGVQTLSEPAD